MRRYDTQLNTERGSVRSGYNRDRSWYATERNSDREHSRLNPEATYWRRPDQLRGDTRGGAAGSYGFGGDYDLVDYRGEQGPGRGPGLGEGRQRRGGAGYDRGLRGGRMGARGGYRSRAGGYDRGYSEWRNNPNLTGYDRGYGSEARPLRPREPLAREIRRENAELVSDYSYREGLSGSRAARRAWDFGR